VNLGSDHVRGFSLNINYENFLTTTYSIYICFLVQRMQVLEVVGLNGVLPGARTLHDALCTVDGVGAQIDVHQGRPHGHGLAVHISQRLALVGRQVAVHVIGLDEHGVLKMGRALHEHDGRRVRLGLDPAPVEPDAHLKLKGARMVLVEVAQIGRPFVDGLEVHRPPVLGVEDTQDRRFARPYISVNGND